MNNSIYHKIRRQTIVMGIVVAAVCALAMLSITIMRGNITTIGRQLGVAAAEEGRASLEAQIEESLLQLAQNKAIIANEKLAAVARMMNSIARQATYIASNPNRYLPRRVEFPNPANTGKTIAQLALAEGVSYASVAAEVGLLGNISDILNIEYDAYSYVGSVYIGTESGFTIFSDADSDVNDRVYDARTRGWYQAAKQANALIWSDVLSDASGRGLFIACAKPYYGANGRLLGVAGAGMDLSIVKEVVVETRLGQSGYAFISNELGEIIISNTVYDYHGEIIISDTIYEDDEGNIIKPKLSDLMPMQTAQNILSGNSGVERVVINGGEYFIAYAPLQIVPWSISMIMSADEVAAPAALSEERIICMTAEAEKNINRIIIVTFGVFVVVITFIITGTIFFSHRMGKAIIGPIRKLTEDVTLISSGKLDHTLQVDTGDELEILVDSFNSMIANVKTITADKERIERESVVKAHETELLQQSHQKLRAILDILPVGVRIMSMDDGTLLYSNQACLQVFNCSSFEEQVKGMNGFTFMPEYQPDGRKTADVVAELFKTDTDTFIAEMQCLKLDGEPFTCRSTSCTISYEGHRASLAVMEDVTAEEEYKRMLENTALREQEASLAKSRFLANMSHEIRTPMNAILGISELQLQKENLSDDTEEALERIYESGNLLLNIINDILDLSKIEAGKLELMTVQYNIPSLLNDTVQLVRLRYESKPLEFNFDIDENTPVNLIGDELRIKQILNNILSNAFKYTDKGKIDLIVRSESSKDDNEDETTIIFCVRDTGQGMTPRQVSMLFDEYTRFNIENNRSIVGAGLGMSITKRLVDLMQGEIFVKSEAGKGSEFTVRLPQKRAGNSVCGKEAAEKLRSSRFHSASILKKRKVFHEYMPYGRVLVVDDVESNIYVAKGMLMPYGLQIDTATSGHEAIEKIKKGNVYDIIFMDHMMPKMDGIEATKIIRETGYKNTIIALTANAIVGQAGMFLENGFNAFISKPIDSRELDLLLNEFICGKKPPQVVEAARSELTARNNRIFNQNNKKKSELKKFFIIDAQKAVSVLEEINAKQPNLDDEDIELISVAVHGIKSALANIGEERLSDIALDIEIAARNKNLTVVAKELPDFINSLESLIKNIKSHQKNVKQEISDEDLKFLHENLSEIITACKALDKKTAKTALNALKQKTWTQEINNALEQLDKYFLHSMFEEAAVLAENTGVSI